MSFTPIFATLAWGFGPDAWGAIGFSSQKVRNSLADDLRKKGGTVLTIGTMGPETVSAEQGRLLGLHKVSTLPIRTGELVEPTLWNKHLLENGGAPKWPFGLPIISAERFDDPQPFRRQLLPRLHNEILHMKLATNYVELTPEEAAAVAEVPRTLVPKIWSTPLSAFATRRSGSPPKGPRPSPGLRTLSISSGPAATYCFVLQGTALRAVTANIAPIGSSLRIYKVGFSNDPERRRRELNTYLPDSQTLEWRLMLMQWHEDEINAWTMEQEVFSQLRRLKAEHIKGEIFSALEAEIVKSWHSAILSSKRPADPVEVTIGQEEAIIEL